VSEEQKAWKCKNGHVIGQVRKAGNGIHQLLLYRQAVDFEGEPEEVDVMAVVEGTVMEIRSSICDEVRTWVTGQVAMEKLIESYGKMIKQTA